MNFRLVLLGLLGLILSGVARADATVVTINDIEYDVTTTASETFYDLGTEVVMQPWWGNLTLATDFAAAVGASLGLPNADSYGNLVNGPQFAFEQEVPGIADLAAQYGGGGTFVTNWAETVPYVYATATMVVTPEPGTAILWFTGVGLMILRRKKLAHLLRLDTNSSLSFPPSH